MKKVIFIIATLALTVSFTSCGSTQNVTSNGADLAGYTLKNKKELMAQKIVAKKSKTVLATP